MARPTERLRRQPRARGGFRQAVPLEDKQAEMRARMRSTQPDQPEPLRHSVSAEELQSVGITPEQAKALLDDRVKASAIDPDTLQLYMSLMEPMMIRLGQELRKPSLKEEKEEAEKSARLKEQRIRAARDGELEQQTIRAQKEGCTHLKDNGDHTWRGQVHSDNWAVVRCMRCLDEYKVRVTPQMMQAGLNLDQVRGLTIGHIRRWAEQSAALDERLKDADKKMSEIQRSVNLKPTELAAARPTV